MKGDYKSFIGAILWVYFFISFIIAAVFFSRFSGGSKWDDPTTWGAFADYFGGLVNPLIGLGNIALLIYISYQLADRDDNRNRLPLMDASVRLLHEILDNIISAASPMTENSSQIINDQLIEFNTWKGRNLHLFPNVHPDRFEDIFRLVLDLLTEARGYEWHYARAEDPLTDLEVRKSGNKVFALWIDLQNMKERLTEDMMGPP